ncbi:hypothetical protein AB7849_09435 [Rhodanobacter sp. 115]|uniref:hypothetical protein n=1 Tax=Rhodanobacter sp. FW021-MT20 TaxID=1162282 RepID=UPI0034E38226
MLPSILEKQAGEAVAHARAVLRDVRTQCNRGANYDPAKVSVVEKQLAHLVGVARDTGMASVIFWRGRWLTYKQAMAALGEVRSVLARIRPDTGSQLRMAA